MDDFTPKTLTCPSCGAPLEVDGTSALVRCKFCKNTAFVPGIAAPQVPESDDFLNEIRRLAESGNTIEAIRRFRELYNVDLGLAKKAVDAMAAGKVVEIHPSLQPVTAEDTSRILEEVKELLKAGNKVEAIKRYREVYDVSLTQAKYAVEQVEAALTGGPPPVRPQIAGTPVAAPKVTRSLNLGCVITVLVLLFIGGLILFIFMQPGGPFRDRLIVNGPAILLPSESGPPDVAASFYNATGENYEVNVVQALDGKLAWPHASITTPDLFDSLVQDGDWIYAANETDLLAYWKSDGSIAWQISMPDRINYNDGAMLITSGRLIVSSVDQSIRVFDALSGALAWERRLSGYDRVLRTFGNSLVVVDYLPGTYNYGLFFLDPLTGSEQRSLVPACVVDEYTSSTIDPDTPLIFDAATDSLIFITDSYPGCIQRLDLASGTPVWQIIPDSSFSFSMTGPAVLQGEDVLYFNTSDQLLSVGRSSGDIQVLLEDPDNELLPLALSGDTLLVRLRRTRGSEKFELMGINAASGAQLWRMDMGAGMPIDPPNEMSGLVDQDSPGWTWHLLNGGLVLVHFQADPHQLLVQGVDLANGSVSSEIPVPLKAVSGDFYSIPEILGWHESLVYISLDANLYAVDVSTGDILFRSSNVHPFSWK